MDFWNRRLCLLHVFLLLLIPCLVHGADDCAFILSIAGNSLDTSDMDLLIYADELEMRSHPGGQLIRLQLERDRLQRSDPSDPRIAPLVAERTRLISQHGPPESFAARVVVPAEGLHPFLHSAGDFVRISIPQGGLQFQMGSPPGEIGRFGDENLRTVTLTRPFEIQRTPVTQLQFALVMGRNPSHFTDGGSLRISDPGEYGHRLIDPHRPVEMVSWNDAQEYVRRLNALEDLKPSGESKYTYRLPTEAEWEYAARGGTQTVYSFGDSPAALPQFAWYSVNAQMSTQRVATLRANPIGLYDVHGNVWEWVQDAYSNNPSGGMDPMVNTGPSRVLRGGGYRSVARYLRSAGRYGPGGRGNDIGLRLVRTIR